LFPRLFSALRDLALMSGLEHFRWLHIWHGLPKMKKETLYVGYRFGKDRIITFSGIRRNTFIFNNNTAVNFIMNRLYLSCVDECIGLAAVPACDSITAII
jgi:hypothetical protein